MPQAVLDPLEGSPNGDRLPPTLASRPLLEPALWQNRPEGGTFQSRGPIRQRGAHGILRSEFPIP